MSNHTSECQPCDKPQFSDNKIVGFENYNYHQCFVCIDGVVRFCYNCNSDHHNNGYESCYPTIVCPRNNILCINKYNRYISQHAGTPWADLCGVKGKEPKAVSQIVGTK